MNPDNPPGGRTAPIKAFVRDTLGCQCPEEVFERIECSPGQADDPWQWRIVVGDRLLIVVSEQGRTPTIEPLIGRLLAAGLALREQAGYNRLRIVLLGENPAELRRQAEAVWRRQPGLDDRTHLHCLHPRALPPQSGFARDDP